MIKKIKTSFFGEIIFIIVLIFFIYLFINELNDNQVKEITKINKEFNVNKDKLIPVDKYSYIAKLNKINNKNISEPIISYIDLVLDSKNIDKSIDYMIVNNSDCIPKTIKFKVNEFILKQNRLINKFEEYENKKMLNKIYWNVYLNNLKNIEEYKKLKTDIDSSEVCS